MKGFRQQRKANRALEQAFGPIRPPRMVSNTRLSTLYEAIAVAEELRNNVGIHPEPTGGRPVKTESYLRGWDAALTCVANDLETKIREQA